MNLFVLLLNLRINSIHPQINYINRILFGIIDVLPLGGPCPFELRKISHTAKTYYLREVAPMENH